MLGLNYIDLIILIVLIYHGIRGYHAGFFALFARLVSFFAAIAGGLMAYIYIGDFIVHHFNTLPAFAYGIGYIVSFFLIQFVVSYLLNLLFQRIPSKIRDHSSTAYTGVLLGVIDGLIFTALILLVLLIAPTPASLRDDIGESVIGGAIARNFGSAEEGANKIFGGAIERSLSLLTTEPESEESISIPYKPSKLTIDQKAEEKMLELVNEERAKVGAPALVMDNTLVAIARAHSKDMWERGYFSHVNPDGDDPFDRMRAGGAKFLRAGENLALAPNVEVAHQGLMNSPGHKRNILDPNFRRVGMGVIDGGFYGQMYTQDFSD